jgi:hypothetical protein
MTVSPDGGYVVFQTNGSPLIVGREYRNNGAGPVWLKHGERPRPISYSAGAGRWQMMTNCAGFTVMTLLEA